jgi:hypothetical protein
MSEARYQGSHLYVHTDFADENIIGCSTLNQSQGIAIGRNVQATVVSHLGSATFFQQTARPTATTPPTATTSASMTALLPQFQPTPEQPERVEELLQSLQGEIDRGDAFDAHAARQVLFDLAQLLPATSRQMLLQRLTTMARVSPAMKIMGRRILG